MVEPFDFIANGPAPGHNPGGLTNKEVGDNFRLTLLTEQDSLRDHKGVEVWYPAKKKWMPRPRPSEPLATYAHHRIHKSWNDIRLGVPVRFNLSDPRPSCPPGVKRCYACIDEKGKTLIEPYNDKHQRKYGYTHYIDILDF